LPATWPARQNAALAVDFVNQGYCSDEGLKNNMGITTETVKAWGGDVVLTTQTEKTDTFTVTLIETMNPEVLKTVYGSTRVSGTLEDGMTVQINSEEQTESIWVVDMVLKGNIAKRVVIPFGKITAIGEVTYSDSGAVGYALTISARPDTDGNTHYEYLKAPSVPDTTLSALSITGCTLSPTFASGTTTYTTSTTDASNVITATATDNEATVVIKNGTTTVTSGNAATWSAGSNTVTVTVTNGNATKTYTVTVTKS
jgi:hypothetical protein